MGGSVCRKCGKPIVQTSDGWRHASGESTRQAAGGAVGEGEAKRQAAPITHPAAK